MRDLTVNELTAVSGGTTTNTHTRDEDGNYTGTTVTGTRRTNHEFINSYGGGGGLGGSGNGFDGPTGLGGGGGNDYYVLPEVIVTASPPEDANDPDLYHYGQDSNDPNPNAYDWEGYPNQQDNPGPDNFCELGDFAGDGLQTIGNGLLALSGVWLGLFPPPDPADSGALALGFAGAAFWLLGAGIEGGTNLACDHGGNVAA